MTERQAILRGVKSRVYGLAMLGIVLVMAGLVIYPLTVMIFKTFVLQADPLAPFQRVFANSQLGRTLTHTLVIAVAAGAMATVVASVFAWLVERTDARIGWVTSILPLVPLLVPPIAMSVGWLILADPTAGYLNVLLRALLGLVGIEMTRGPLNIASWPGVLFAYTVYLVPFCYLVISSGLKAIDPALEEASRTSGAGVWRTLWSVSLPALKPAIVGGILVATIFAVAVYSIPSTLGAMARVRPVSVEIVELMQTYPAEIGQAVVLSLFVLVILGGLWLLQRRLSRQGRHAVVGGKAAGWSVIELGAFRPFARALLIGYILIAAVLPAVGLTVVALQPYWSPQLTLDSMSFANFQNLFAPGSATRAALINSLSLGFIGATIVMAAATLLVAHARETKGRLGQFTEGVTKMPGAIPHVVFGVAFILSFAGWPFHLYGTKLILLLAYVTMYIPQASIAAATAYDQVGHELFEASRISGAGRATTLGRIALPLMRPGLAAGWMLVFVVITGELTASVLLSGTRNPVVGYVFLQIWDGGTFPQLAAFAVVFSSITSLLVVIVTVWFSGSRGRRQARSASAAASFPAERRGAADMVSAP